MNDEVAREETSNNFGNVTLEPGDVVVDGNVLPLTGLEFNVLKLLLERPGLTVTHDAFAKISDRASNVIQVAILRIRKKLKAAGAGVFIDTIRGIGYRLELNN